MWVSMEIWKCRRLNKCFLYVPSTVAVDGKKKCQSCNSSITGGYMLDKCVSISVETSVGETNLIYYVLNHRHCVTLKKNLHFCFGFHTYKVGGDSLEKWEKWITSNLATAELRRNILAGSSVSKGSSKTPHSLTGNKKITSSLNPQKALNFQIRRTLREIFLSCPFSSFTYAVMQLITKPGSFPVHSLCAAAAIPELTTVAMLAQDFRYINQEWSNWQCQNKSRNECRFTRMKLSYPTGVQLSYLRKFECRPFINFLVTKHRTPHTTLMWADISSGRELLQ